VNALLPKALADLLAREPALEQAYLVGGCVRDWLLGVPVKDFDIEVFGVDENRLITALQRWGRVNLVGRSFGVVKLTLDGQTHDFSLPRRDSKVAPGHQGFRIEFDPSISPRDAAARRDFTINSLMWSPGRQDLLDPFGGQADLRSRTLRHTSAAFPEDPLRVLRGMQFAARFRLTAAPETVALCRSIVGTYPELAQERVREEWFKWAAQSAEPSAGLRFLRDTGWVSAFPELEALIGVEQDPEWHPEGDVWTHTGHALEALVTGTFWREADRDTRVVLSLATLAHDLGKPSCTRREIRDGRERIVSPGHEPAGGPLTESFLGRLNTPPALVARIVPLVTNHLAHLAEPTPRSVRRLALRLTPATIEELSAVITADASGRPPRPAGEPEGVARLRSAAAELALAAAAPRPILQGRHLLERGLKPGPGFTPILSAAFEAQLDGAFADVDGARAWLSNHLAESSTPPNTGPETHPAPLP